MAMAFTTVLFFWALSNYVLQSVRIQNYEADLKMRDEFDRTAPDTDAARKLMREAGYRV